MKGPRVLQKTDFENPKLFLEYSVCQALGEGYSELQSPCGSPGTNIKIKAVISFMPPTVNFSETFGSEFING